ncbi:MAG TPA: hypothetical protein VFT04_04160 [Gemmatimonadales bacterium]|nr:hypothetical protein [Gemmatimonadales bacterium]
MNNLRRSTGKGSRASGRDLARTSRLAAFWAFAYGVYRWYYALGGTIGKLGTPHSHDDWVRINAIAGVLLFAAALLPLLFLRAWRYRRAQPFLLAIAWIIAVGCSTHALIGIPQRLASLAGVLTIEYPFWRSIDERAADLQALFFNEPWFLVEGALWGAIAWAGALRESPRRTWWIGSAVGAIVVLTAVGLLSAFGVIGRWVVG